jgi:hypothetical protein
VKQSIREETVVTFIPSIIPGHTTKDEVFLALGEPDEVSPDENRLVYRWRKLKFAALITGLPPTASADVTAEEKYRLVLTFDERGRVLQKKVEIDSDWSSSFLPHLWRTPYGP